MTTVMNIPLDQIETAPQVRTKFGQAGIEELAADIKAHGVLQPLVVRQRGDKFLLLIGERRFRACRFLGAATVPAIVATVADELAEEVQLTENIQREDLNAKDLAAAIEKLWRKHGSVSEVAKRVKKSPSWVSKRLALALDVGVHTCALMDGNVKDVELLYNFGKLEKINPAKARDMVPAIIGGEAGREDVKAAILENSDMPEKADTLTGDLFEGEQQSPSPAPAIEAATAPNMEELLRKQLQIAMAALHICVKEGGKGKGSACRAEALAAIRQIDDLAGV